MKARVLVNHVPRRAIAYPSIQDQLDMLFKGFKQMQDSGQVIPPAIAEWIQQLEQVKRTFPKAPK